MTVSYCVEIADLSFAYPDGRQALRDVSLNVRTGEKVALVGPNGAGKSTLLLHLNGLLQGKGDVRVMGRAVQEPHLARIRARVGLVFQNPDDQLFSPTVFDDVAFGPLYAGLPEDEVRQRVAWALAQVELEDYAARISHHLSLGEKKRAAIATVLSMQPDILALDEPTAGLDPRTRGRLIGLLRNLPQTILIATHDMNLVARICRRAVILDEGRVVADGPMREIMTDERLLEIHGLEKPQTLAPHAHHHHHNEHAHVEDDEQEDSDARKELLTKLSVLLPHWIEHNGDHADSFCTWAEQARAVGEVHLASHIEEAAHRINAANRDLRGAIEHIDADMREHEHMEHDHPHAH